MAETRDAFAGGDQAYLRDKQYHDGSKLDARTELHKQSSTSAVAFADFEAGLTDWAGVGDILECGTGTGRFWDNNAVSRTASLTLTDLSAGMVEEAVARAGSNRFVRVLGQQCDVQDLPFADESFDAAIANHMLYHVPDPDLALAELARVLRPDGVLLAATNARGHMGEMLDTVAEVFGEQRSDIDDVFGMDVGERRLRRQFTSVAWFAYDNDLVVTDVDLAVAYGLSFPPGESATKEQSSAFRDAIERRFVDGEFRIRTRTGAFVCSGIRPVETRDVEHI